MTKFGVITEFRGEYAWLSNFHRAPVHVTFNLPEEGLQEPPKGVLTRFCFQTVEAAYIACKSTDAKWWRYCASLGSSRQEVAELKAAARSYEQEDANWLRPHWDVLKVAVMHDLLCQKFENEELAALLKGTVGMVIEEGNTWKDDFWGIDRNRRPQRGLNMLGKLIMEIRDALLETGEPYGRHAPTLRGYLCGTNRG